MHMANKLELWSAFLRWARIVMLSQQTGPLLTQTTIRNPCPVRMSDLLPTFVGRKQLPLECVGTEGKLSRRQRQHSTCTKPPTWTPLHEGLICPGHPTPHRRDSTEMVVSFCGTSILRLGVGTSEIKFNRCSRVCEPAPNLYRALE